METSTKRMACVGVLFIGVCALACSSGGTRQTYEDAAVGAEQAGNDEASVDESSPTEGVVPNPEVVARARAAGIPAIDPSGVMAAGPFEGPGGTLLYIGRDAKLTFYQPEQAVAYFGTQTPDGITYQYVLSLQGQFIVDANNQASQVQALPDDSLTWPHAESIAQVFIGTLQAIRAGQRAAPSNSQTDWGAMSNASRAMHDTNMAIINNMGSAGCTKHYDDVYYLGCW